MGSWRRVLLCLRAGRDRHLVTISVYPLVMKMNVLMTSKLGFKLGGILHPIIVSPHPSC